MKAGDIVNIYQGDELEGKAMLIKPSDIGNEGLADGFEFWKVLFLDEDENQYDRIVSNPKLCRCCGAHLANWKEMLHEDHVCK